MYCAHQHHLHPTLPQPQWCRTAGAAEPRQKVHGSVRAEDPLLPFPTQTVKFSGFALRMTVSNPTPATCFHQCAGSATPLFLPTAALRLFDVLHQSRPNHVVIAQDFDDLQAFTSVSGVNAPLVAETVGGQGCSTDDVHVRAAVAHGSSVASE